MYKHILQEKYLKSKPQMDEKYFIILSFFVFLTPTPTPPLYGGNRDFERASPSHTHLEPN